MEIGKEIHRPRAQALGDCWMDLNYFINRGLENNEITRLSVYYWKGEAKKWALKLKEILPLLKHEKMIQLGEWDATAPKIDWQMGWKYPFVPTKQTWSPNNSRKMCYQFDAKSKKEGRFPTAAIENDVLEHATKLGYEVTVLNRFKSLARCVHEAATSEIFLGVDSGMLKLASAVGIPTLYCKNGRELKYSCDQSNVHFVLSADATEFKASVDSYHKGGLDYYVANATHLELFEKRQKDG